MNFTLDVVIETVREEFLNQFDISGVSVDQ